MSELNKFKDDLRYDPLTGNFYWVRKRAGRNIIVGSLAGNLSRQGYWTIGFNYKVYKAHRLAWLYMKGEWPKKQLDHINRNRADNRWVNLREATSSQNRVNACVSSHSKLGIKGVRLRPYGKYCVRIQIDGKQREFGSFDTIEEAKAAYLKTAKELYGEFARG